jgi:hypothetical protein
MQANLYGSPEDIRKLMHSFVQGQSVATAVGGFLEAADPRTLASLDSLQNKLADATRALTERLARKESNGAGASDGEPISVTEIEPTSVAATEGQ